MEARKPTGIRILSRTAEKGPLLPSAVEGRMRAVDIDSTTQEATLMMENRTEQRELLKQYLNQYYRLGRRVRTLERRLKEAKDELQHPSIKSSLGDMTPSKGSQSIGAAAPTLREDAIAERLMQERDRRTQAMDEILNVLDLLPATKERELLEYRHIDCMRWKEIYRRANLTRSPCFKYYNHGLDQLLASEYVQERLAAFEVVQ